MEQTRAVSPVIRNGLDDLSFVGSAVRTDPSTVQGNRSAQRTLRKDDPSRQFGITYPARSGVLGGQYSRNVARPARRPGRPGYGFGAITSTAVTGSTAAGGGNSGQSQSAPSSLRRARRWCKSH